VEVPVVEQVEVLGEDLAVVLEVVLEEALELVEVLEVVEVLMVIGFNLKYSQSYYVMCYS
jgi:hypothetical protein